MVGVDSSQAEFNTVEKTGGSKYLQEHKHEGLAWWGDYANQSITLNGGGYPGYNLTYGGGNAGDITAIHTRNAGTGNSGNLQPYITCYMWKRVA